MTVTAVQRSVRQDLVTCSKDGCRCTQSPHWGGGGAVQVNLPQEQSAGPQLSSVNAGRLVIIFGPRLLRQWAGQVRGQKSKAVCFPRTPL